jgi:hypothetical protein
METLFTADEMRGVTVLEANDMSTSYIENLGGGKFRIRSLPVETQIAPVNGIVVDDVDGDGNLDALLVGNDFGNEVFAGRHDAFVGLVLKGDGAGNFRAEMPSVTGFNVGGDAKALVRVTEKGRDLYIASQNKSTLKAFVVDRPNGYVCAPQNGDAWCDIVLSDGKKRKHEFYYGSGYLSQSGRKLRVPSSATSLTIHSVDGSTRNVDTSTLK